MELKDLSTKELFKELEKREAVEKISIEPYADLAIFVNGEQKPLPVDSGPCQLLIIWD